jgi:hypothetical protein
MFLTPRETSAHVANRGGVTRFLSHQYPARLLLMSKSPNKWQKSCWPLDISRSSSPVFVVKYFLLLHAHLHPGALAIGASDYSAEHSVFQWQWGCVGGVPARDIVRKYIGQRREW